MTGLPKGWELSTVGELGEYINGRGFKKTEWAATGRPIIRIQNLTGSGSGFNYFDGQLEDRYVVPSGALLVSWAATLGVYRWDGPEGALNQHIFRVHSYVNEDFHRYVLKHALNLMQEYTHGSGMVHITRDRFASTPVPLPPLAEQGRVVAAIEEAFSKLDAGEAGLRTVRQLLKRMRDAILAAAVTGRLVPQDPTDTPATKLLADLGVEPLPTGDDLPDGWAVARLDDGVGHGAITDGPFGSHLKTEHYTAAGPRVVRLQNIGNGEFRDEKAFISEERFRRLRKHEVLEGDLLVASLGEVLPRACMAPSWLGPAIVKADCIRVRPGGAFSGPFLMLALNSGPVRAVVADVIKGVGRPRLNLGELRNLALPVPPLAEQNRIATEVERQLSFIDACERAVDAGLARSAALRRSVLKAAFEGRLVPQDPTDEPASVLLERIRAERAAAPKPKGRRARSTT